MASKRPRESSGATTPATEVDSPSRSEPGSDKEILEKERRVEECGGGEYVEHGTAAPTLAQESTVPGDAQPVDYEAAARAKLASVQALSRGTAASVTALKDMSQSLDSRMVGGMKEAEAFAVEMAKVASTVGASLAAAKADALAQRILRNRDKVNAAVTAAPADGTASDASALPKALQVELQSVQGYKQSMLRCADSWKGRFEQLLQFQNESATTATERLKKQAAELQQSFRVANEMRTALDSAQSENIALMKTINELSRTVADAATMRTELGTSQRVAKAMEARLSQKEIAECIQQAAAVGDGSTPPAADTERSDKVAVNPMLRKYAPDLFASMEIDRNSLTMPQLYFLWEQSSREARSLRDDVEVKTKEMTRMEHLLERCRDGLEVETIRRKLAEHSLSQSLQLRPSGEDRALVARLRMDIAALMDDKMELHCDREELKRYIAGLTADNIELKHAAQTAAEAASNNGVSKAVEQLRQHYEQDVAAARADARNAKDRVALLERDAAALQQNLDSARRATDVAISAKRNVEDTMQALQNAKSNAIARSEQLCADLAKEQKKVTELTAALARQELPFDKTCLNEAVSSLQNVVSLASSAEQIASRATDLSASVVQQVNSALAERNRQQQQDLATMESAVSEASNVLGMWTTSAQLSREARKTLEDRSVKDQHTIQELWSQLKAVHTFNQELEEKLTNAEGHAFRSSVQLAEKVLDRHIVETSECPQCQARAEEVIALGARVTEMEIVMAAKNDRAVDLKARVEELEDLYNTTKRKLDTALSENATLTSKCTMQTSEIDRLSDTIVKAVRLHAAAPPFAALGRARHAPAPADGAEVDEEAEVPPPQAEPALPPDTFFTDLTALAEKVSTLRGVIDAVNVPLDVEATDEANKDVDEGDARLTVTAMVEQMHAKLNELSQQSEKLVDHGKALAELSSVKLELQTKDEETATFRDKAASLEAALEDAKAKVAKLEASAAAAAAAAPKVDQKTAIALQVVEAEKAEMGKKLAAVMEQLKEKDADLLRTKQALATASAAPATEGGDTSALKAALAECRAKLESETKRLEEELAKKDQVNLAIMKRFTAMKAAGGGGGDAT